MNPHHRCEPPPEFLERFSPEPRDLELGTAEVLTSSHSGKRRTDEDIRRKVVALTSDHGEEFRDPLIVPRSRQLGASPMLFRLTEDPTETRAVHFPDPGVAGYLDRLLRAREETGIAALESIDADLDQDLINELKALGYLE